MQTLMNLVIYGAEAGVIVDKETGKRIDWAAVHVAHSFDGRDSIGMKTERLKAKAEVMDSLRAPGVKFPLEVQANVELKASSIEGRGMMMSMSVLSLVSPVRKAA